MIKPSQVVTHLGRYLPRATDLFNETIAASSASVSGSTVTIITPSAHGLTVGAAVTISGGKVNVPISAVSVVDGSATITTSVDHDQTFPRMEDDTDAVILGGFTDSLWNGSHSIASVDNRRSIGITAPSTSPTLTGSEVLIEERSASFFGIQTVANVPDDTTLTIEVSGVPSMDGLDLTDVELVTAVRVAAASTIERADALYTEFGNSAAWAFVIMTDVDVSKDRHSINDSIASFGVQDEMRLRVLQNFSTVVFLPTDASLTGTTSQELAYDEIYSALLRVMYGFSGFASADDGSAFVTVTAGHGLGQYNTAYYTQVYDWQTPVDITVNNGFNFFESVAFRDIGATFDMNEVGNNEKLTLAIDLDDEPL